MERCVFDPNQPKGAMSLNNLRNLFRALFQMDVMPLRARASYVLDDFEYSTNASAQNEWSGTGVTVTTNSSDKQEGNFCLQAVVDATGDRQLRRSENLNLSGFKKIKLWERCSVVSSAIQFLLKDNLGNESYWNITTNPTANTWQQDELDLLNPDGHNGAYANLSNIVEFGFKGLDASTTYLFDTNKAICGKNVAVASADVGSFYKQVWISKVWQYNKPIDFAGGASPTINNPNSNPRIDILYINASGTLAWVVGDEAASPVPKWENLSVNVIAICLVYCKPLMTKVVDYEDKDSYPSDGYIYADCRSFLNLRELLSFLDLPDTPSSYSGQANKYVKVNSGENALEFVNLVLTFLALTDTPSSYSGQSGKSARVNSSENALEFAFPNATYAA